MLKAWVIRIRSCQFEPEIWMMKDGKTSVNLWGQSPTVERLKIFTDLDPDKCMETALQYAENYDAYVNNAALCGIPH